MDNEVVVAHEAGGVKIMHAPSEGKFSPELLGAGSGYLTTLIVIEASNGSVEYVVTGWDRYGNVLTARRTGSAGAIPE